MTIYLDWLQRTDPYNLYPFVTVLPIGGLFVGKVANFLMRNSCQRMLSAYYNEARILDQRTFQTIKILPNSPAAVNNYRWPADPARREVNHLMPS